MLLFIDASAMRDEAMGESCILEKHTMMSLAIQIYRDGKIPKAAVKCSTPYNSFITMHLHLRRCPLLIHRENFFGVGIHQVLGCII